MPPVSDAGGITRGGGQAGLKHGAELRAVLDTVIGALGHHHERPLGMVQHSLGGGAEQHPSEPAASAGTQHSQLGRSESLRPGRRRRPRRSPLPRCLRVGIVILSSYDFPDSSFSRSSSMAWVSSMWVGIHTRVAPNGGSAQTRRSVVPRSLASCAGLVSAATRP